MNIPFFSRNTLVVGIDIGSHAIKICQFKKAGNKYQLVALGSILLPEGAVDDGTLNDPEAVSTALGDLLRNLKIKNKKVGFSISGYSVIVKKVALEAMDDHLLENHIMAEAEQYIPFDREDVYLDFQDLKTSESNDRTEVMLVAAKKDVVQDYLDMFESLDLTPVLVDVDGFAFENSFEQANPDVKNVALIDIGASKMSINILSNGISVVARDVVLGSQQLTDQIQDLLGIETAKAEAIKLGTHSVDNELERIQQIFSSICTQWILEIKKSVDLYHANHPNQPLHKIILGGGGAKVSGFKDFLEQETDLKVEIFTPFNGVQVNEKTIDPQYLKNIGPEMAIAAGIALRESVI